MGASHEDGRAEVDDIGGDPGALGAADPGLGEPVLVADGALTVDAVSLLFQQLCVRDGPSMSSKSTSSMCTRKP